MARADWHSRLVGWLKVILPLAALALLSILFLVSRTIDPMEAVPRSPDGGAILGEPKLTAPEFAGTTADGAALALSAREVRPGAGSGVDASLVGAQLDTPDGASVEMQAAVATLDPTGAQFTLSGGVELVTSSRYLIRAEAVAVATDQTRLESLGPVQVDGPVGRITAGGMILTADPKREGAYLLVFKAGVKLLYQPGE